MPRSFITLQFSRRDGNMLSSKHSRMPAKLITPELFRKVLSQFPTGVTVVTAPSGPGRVHGMTANSFTSVSLTPPLILVCVDQRAKLLSCVMQTRQFGVSILKESQRELSLYFSKPEQTDDENEKLGIHYSWTVEGVPLLNGTLARFACRLNEAHPAGDHSIVVGGVEFAEMEAGQPLLFFDRLYGGVTRHNGQHE